MEEDEMKLPVVTIYAWNTYLKRFTPAAYECPLCKYVWRFKKTGLTHQKRCKKWLELQKQRGEE